MISLAQLPVLDMLTKFWMETQSWKENLDPVITKPITPEDSAWDSFKPPVSLYVATSFYVVTALFLGPPLLRYRPTLPFHVAFFLFNLSTLIANFCLFMNSLILFNSKSSLPIQLLSLILEEDGALIVNLTWLHCAVKLFEFLGEALTILHHKHDNYRFLRITYFLIQLTNVWITLRFGAPDLLSLSTVFNLVCGLMMLFYTSFEASMHTNCPQLNTKVERLICALEVFQFFMILGQVLPRPDESNEGEFSKPFMTYMFAFGCLSILMLIIISWKADVVIRDTSTLVKQGRQSVIFKEYNYRPLRDSDGRRSTADSF